MAHAAAAPVTPPLAAPVQEGFWGSKTRLQKGSIAALVVVLFFLLWATKNDAIGKKLRALVLDPNTQAATAASGAIFLGMTVVTALGIWALLDNKENRLLQHVKKLFENKSEQQTRVLVSAAVVIFLALPFILLAAQGCEPFKEGWDKVQNYITNPTPNLVNALPVTVMALGAGALATQVARALVQNKDSSPWWEKKSELQQKALYTMAAVAVIAAIFVFLTAKGVEPLDKGWENFKELITDQSSNVLKALPTVGIILGCMGAAGVSLWNLFATRDTALNLKIQWWREKGLKRYLKVVGLLFLAAITYTILYYKGVDVGVRDIREALGGDAFVSSQTFGSMLIFAAIILIGITTIGYLVSRREKTEGEKERIKRDIAAGGTEEVEEAAEEEAERLATEAEVLAIKEAAVAEHVKTRVAIKTGRKLERVGEAVRKMVIIKALQKEEGLL